MTARPRADGMLDDLRRAGLKLTPQRIAIVRTFADDPSHPTAHELFERLRVNFPTMSFATVYNTLDALASCGLTGTVQLPGSGSGGRSRRFDPNTEPHHHAVCDRCGGVVDVHARPPPPETIDRLRHEAPGFRVRTEERTYRGICGRCASPR